MSEWGSEGDEADEADEEHEEEQGDTPNFEFWILNFELICPPYRKRCTTSIAEAELTTHFSINTEFTISLQALEKTYK